MTRVLMVLPAISRQGGGVAEAVRNLADALGGQKGLTLEIATTRDGDFDADRRAWGDHRVTAARFFGPRGFRFSPGLLWRVIMAPADLIHLHGLWTFMGLAVVLRALLRGTPYILSPHGMAEPLVRARNPARKRWLGQLYQNRLLRRASAIHALTGSEARDIEAIAPRTPIVVIPNCIAPAAVDGVRPGWWRRELETRRVFLFFGRIHEAKGWRALLHGWALACRASPNFCQSAQLVFCGWPDRSDDFEAAVAGAAAGFGNVVYAGPQFDMARTRTLGAAHLVVLPSQTEGLPMTILEAFALGTPVLMTRQCNLTEGFDRGAAIEIGTDPEAIAAGLLSGLILSPQTRERMSAAGRALVGDTFSPPVVARAFTRAYETAVSAHPLRPERQRPPAPADG